ncbi:MAG: hypothetical protein JEZ06_22625 [Anaerolineaceae bacterium]|nr:hypothetical protein [Anaerolineaceae bacterium]
METKNISLEEKKLKNLKKILWYCFLGLSIPVMLLGFSLIPLFMNINNFSGADTGLIPPGLMLFTNNISGNDTGLFTPGLMFLMAVLGLIGLIFLIAIVCLVIYRIFKYRLARDEDFFL